MQGENGVNSTILPMKPRFMKRYWPHLLAVLSLGLLILVSFLFWIEISKRFPRVQPGSYMGAILGEALGESLPTRFYLERLPNGDDLFFVIIREGWRPQVVSPVKGEGGGSDWTLPVVLDGPGGALKFTGATSGPQEYRGAVMNVSTGKEGHWQLNALKEEASARSENETSEVRLWLLLNAETDDVEEQIARAEKKVPEQRAEIARLTELITEGQQLKSKANEKHAAVMHDLENAKAELNARRAELKKLEEAFDMAQRVTGAGKLASLSRESLDREWRWVNSMLSASPQERSAELEQAFEKGERILKLKQDIEQEAQTIRSLGGEPEAISGGAL